MDLHILFLPSHIEINTGDVMPHSRDDYRKEELNLQKLCFFMF